MKRLIAALVAILAVGLGFGQVIRAIPTPTPSALIYSYDGSPHCDEETSSRPPERGPPAWAAIRGPVCQGVVLGSHVSSPGPSDAEAAAMYVYDAGAGPVQVDGVTSSVGVRASTFKGRVSPLPALGVAAEAGVGRVAAGPRVFWSGDGAEAAATRFASRTGSQTLGMTERGIVTARATENLPWSEARPMWVKASQEFADGASGTVHVFHGPKVSLGSVWAETEWKALLDNPAVDDIVFHVVGVG